MLSATLLLSITFRIGVALYLGNIVDAPQLLTDQRAYHRLGVRLAEGYGFSFAENNYPFTPANTPTSHWSFLQSLFVAGVYSVFGAHPLAARLVEAVLGGLLLPLMVFRLARRVFPAIQPGTVRLGGVRYQIPDTLPLLSAFLAATYLYFVLYAATLMTETFYIVALLWSLERAMAVVDRWRVAASFRLREVVALGIALGLATLFRQSILPWIAVLFAWLLWAGYRTHALRYSLLAISISALILSALVLPFTIRNYTVYDEFLLLNSNAGYAMYSSQHPMHGTSFQEFNAPPVPPELAGLNEAQLDRELMRRGIGFVLDEPGRYLLLSLSRVRDYFEFWPSSDTTLLHNIGRVGSFGLLLPFMLYGLWVSIRQQLEVERAPKRRSRFATLSHISISNQGLLYLFVISYSLLHIFTWAFPRYRLPVDSVLILFAALGITDIVRRLIATGNGLALRQVSS
ncbi:MAG: hypothetical protein KDI55_10600 [Anaerolineae bacterium]|nr:hypothetical protein [Anaerolineae bacterium]